MKQQAYSEIAWNGEGGAEGEGGVEAHSGPWEGPCKVRMYIVHSWRPGQ